MTYLTGWSRISVISFYMTFANLFGLLFGATNLVPTLFIFSVVSLASAFLQKYKLISILSLALLFIIPVIIPISLVNIIILIPPTTYLIYDVIARLLNTHPSLDYPRIFIIFVIIFLPIVFILTTFGSGHIVRMMMIPFGFTFFLSTVTLLRSARHKEEVLRSKLFHFLNFLTPLLLLCGGFLLSTDFVGNILSFILRNFFLYLVRPVFMLFFWIISWIFFIIVYIFPMNIHDFGDEMEAPDFPRVFMEEDIDPYHYGEVAAIPWFIRSLIILLLVAICVFILIKIFRSMNYRLSSFALQDNEHETRRRLEDNHILVKKRRRRSTGNQIRDIYYDYLRLCGKRGILIEPYMTSADICAAATEFDDEDSHMNLRMMYIKSRYGGYEYTKSDVQRAKQLYREIQKKTPNVKGSSAR